MKPLEATYRIITPMFIGDAEQKATDLRPPSIKGGLRFWWRALNWKNVDSLKELHEEESRLFGSAATDNNTGGQGCFLLQVSQQPKINSDATWPEKANSGSCYLAYGLMESGSIEDGNLQEHRTAIKELNNKFSISLLFKPNTPNSDIKSITKTLEIWGLFGGLGSRVRNGFGSVGLLSLDNTNYDYSLDEYCTKINSLLTTFDKIEAYPPYTAFSQYSRFEVIKSSETSRARDSHNIAGAWYKEQRLNLDWEQRISLGLPLNVNDAVNARTSLGSFLKENENIRRSSPLIFHVQQLKNKSFVTGVLYLPAQFHPKHPNPYPNSDLTEFYQPTTQLLDKLK